MWPYSLHYCHSKENQSSFLFSFKLSVFVKCLEIPWLVVQICEWKMISRSTWHRLPVHLSREQWLQGLERQLSVSSRPAPLPAPHSCGNPNYHRPSLRSPVSRLRTLSALLREKVTHFPQGPHLWLPPKGKNLACQLLWTEDRRLCWACSCEPTSWTDYHGDCITGTLREQLQVPNATFHEALRRTHNPQFFISSALSCPDSSHSLLSLEPFLLLFTPPWIPRKYLVHW